MIKKLSALLIIFVLVGCGPSLKEKQEIAQLTCNVTAATRNMDSAIRLREVNSARKQLGEARFLGTDDDIIESFKYGLCTELVLNDPEYANKLNELKRIEREAIAKAEKEKKKRQAAERITREKRKAEERAKKLEAERRGEIALTSCVYMVDNPFVADPYMACRTNVTEEACMVLEEEGDGMMEISGAIYGEGDCSREASIGSCERGGWEEVYYEGEGDPVSVEFGCGFAGDWLEPVN